MRKVRNFVRSAFDIREGERLRTLFLSLYLFFVLVAHYILKTISRSMFVTQFGSDELPYLYILIAVVGGLIATVYTKVALRTSLQAAVTWVMGLSGLALIACWQLLPYDWKWLVYGFNIFAQLFGVVIVAQGWLVASNVYTSQEAKRLYGMVGLGAVLGGWVGAAFTRATVNSWGPYPLLLVATFLVGLAYISFRLTSVQKGVTLTRAKGAEEEPEKVSTRDILVAIGRYRHLQVIAAIAVTTFIVDQLVEFQLQAAGAQVYGNVKAYSVFLSTYYLYQNIITFILQFVLTGVVVSRLGVGGTLRLMPIALGVTSLGPLLWPGVIAAAVTRLTEAATRYSINRTAMELLYLPLPLDLRNRTKAFLDVFGDRVGRGLAAVLLLGVQWIGFKEDLTKIPLVVIGFTVIWIFLSRRAQKEYLLTVRTRLDSRRLDLESARVNVGDPSMLALVEKAARSKNARQATYALSLLAEAPGYPLAQLFQELVASPSGEVRGKVYELGKSVKSPELIEPALKEVQRLVADPAAVKPAVAYLLAVSPDSSQLAREFLDHADPLVTETTLETLVGRTELAQELITQGWLSIHAADADPERRRLAALAVAARGDEGTEVLYRLLDDAEPSVAATACRAAGVLQNRTYLHLLVPKLADARLRGVAIESLAAYGVRVSGTLGDILEDESSPVAIRRQVPRVLKAVADQRNVDVLLRSINQRNLIVRAAVLKALNRLRETDPKLDFGNVFVTKQILNEAKSYFELSAALAPFKKETRPRTAAGLLARSIEERLRQTLERLFRLLGLRYPPKEIYAAYLALQHRRGEQSASALEFLDNILDRDLKKSLLPALDGSGDLVEKGRDLFGVEIRSTEEAIRELIRSGDSWLVTCAIAAAAELKLRNLAPEIEKAARGAGAEVGQVALAAQAALA